MQATRQGSAEASGHSQCSCLFLGRGERESHQQDSPLTLLVYPPHLLLQIEQQRRHGTAAAAAAARSGLDASAQAVAAATAPPVPASEMWRAAFRAAPRDLQQELEVSFVDQVRSVAMVSFIVLPWCHLLPWEMSYLGPL